MPPDAAVDRPACGCARHLKTRGIRAMAKPGRKVKKANHGKRPANSKTRKQKRQRVKT
jgi:hypothetical protein